MPNLSNHTPFNGYNLKMVKVDSRHDYYADLECTSGADAGEIKKQYRKLGTTAIRSLRHYSMFSLTQVLVDISAQVSSGSKPRQ